jgi:putative phage-type endonuclease
MAKLLNIPQRSAEWFVWRGAGIGSSDAGILMGVNQYRSVQDLWLEKTKQVIRPFTDNEDMARGRRLEDKALQIFLSREKIELHPMELEHSKYSFIKASLDGGNWELKRLAEIKCPREHNHRKTRNQQYIKPEYWAQMQHQFIATGFQRGDFLSYFENEDGSAGELISIVVMPDPWYMGELIDREIKFWESVQNKVAPNPKDYLPWNPGFIQDDL